MLPIVQINLQRNYGGGETYTKAIIKALFELGCDLHLITHPKAHFWARLNLPLSLVIKPLGNTKSLIAHLSGFRDKGIVLSHGPLKQELIDAARSCGWKIMAICHMPPQGRHKDEFNDHQLVFGVSDYVIEGLRKHNVNTWPTALLGTADLSPRGPSNGSLKKASEYLWDTKKARDVVLGYFNNWFEFLRKRTIFIKKPGITIGIFSRITPIKQFPLLFSILAPIISKYPNVNLEIFGAGGFASIRDFKRSLAPCKHQVRFWGAQMDPALVFRNLDFLMAGLPEKEALGLNVIEAQFLNVPVLAVRAPPFTQTILENKTGFLFRDPREDHGEEFHKLLLKILSGSSLKLAPVQHQEHLELFSFQNFKMRLSQTPLLRRDIS
jgi:glycosyltransferase involved in cell wall biosynthesis